MKANSIDVVYVGGYHTSAGLMLRQMRAQGLTAQMISGDAIATTQFWSITGDAGTGMMFTFGPDPRKRPAAAKVVQQFKAKGIDPEGYTLYTYAAIQVWAEAAAKAKTTDPEEGRRRHPWRQVGHGAGPDRLRQEGRHRPPRLRVLHLAQGRHVSGSRVALTRRLKREARRSRRAFSFWTCPGRGAASSRSPQARREDRLREARMLRCARDTRPRHPILPSAGNASSSHTLIWLRLPVRKAMPVSTSSAPMACSTRCR